MFEINAILGTFPPLVLLLVSNLLQAVLTYNPLNDLPAKDKMGSLSTRAVTLQTVLYAALAISWPFRLNFSRMADGADWAPIIMFWFPVVG
jgi:hypothetical protein